MFVMLMFMILMTVLIMTPSIRTSLGTTADPDPLAAAAGGVVFRHHGDDSRHFLHDAQHGDS